jgi:hypothetical protein
VQINLTIVADNASEFQEALKAILSGVPEATFSGAPATAYTVTVEPTVEPAPPPPAGISVEIARPAAGSDTKPPRKGRPAQADAAPAVATVAAPGGKPMTPEDAKQAALDILRDLFAFEKTPGDAYGATAVKQLQASMGVDKFVKVPDDRGAELLARAQALHAKLTGGTSDETPEDEIQDETETEAAF